MKLLTIKDLKKHSPRLVGEVETGAGEPGSWATEQRGCAGKKADGAGKAGMAERGTEDSKPAVNYCGGCNGRKTLSLTGEFVGKLG